MRLTDEGVLAHPATFTTACGVRPCRLGAEGPPGMGSVPALL
ncbi:hypothetical protein [Pseudodesulfovibrio alkaliphilus]|nr:hypothetical protein [Pseudodesulfovibrio alkaliphilus]